MSVTMIHLGLRARRAGRRSARSRSLRVSAVAVVSVVIAGACDGSFEADGVVKITPESLAWVGPGPFEASATIQQANGDPIPDTFTVEAEVTWATPPGQEPVRRRLTAAKTVAGPYHVAGINALSAQMATVNWTVTGTEGQLLAESEPVEVQVDCPDGPEPYLRSMQTAVTGMLSGLDPIDGISLLTVGYALNNHGWAQLPGGGVSFVGPGNPLDFEEPPLLLFTAPEGSDITDNEPDDDLMLAGWGYGSLKTNDERPTLGCVPYHLWSVHAAGWHTPNDGGMVLDDGTQDSADQAGERGGTGLTYHPQLWDVHFWLEPGSDVPSSSLFNTDDDGGLIPSEGGSTAPDGMFFFPPFPIPAGAG